MSRVFDIKQTFSCHQTENAFICYSYPKTNYIYIWVFCMGMGWVLLKSCIVTLPLIFPPRENMGLVRLLWVCLSANVKSSNYPSSLTLVRQNPPWAELPIPLNLTATHNFAALGRLPFPPTNMYTALIFRCLTGSQDETKSRLLSKSEARKGFACYCLSRWEALSSLNIPPSQTAESLTCITCADSKDRKQRQ